MQQRINTLFFNLIWISSISFAQGGIEQDKKEILFDECHWQEEACQDRSLEAVKNHFAQLQSKSEQKGVRFETEAGFTDEDFDNFHYGDKRFTEYLQYVAKQGNFQPVENMLDFCKNIFIKKYGEDSPVNVALTLAMAVDSEATQEEALAGYVLSLTLVFKLTRQLREEGRVPVEAQIRLLNLCYEHVIGKFPWAFYQIENYFNQLPVMQGGFQGLPKGKK